MNAVVTEHKLDFLAAIWQQPIPDGIDYISFIIGTCHGLYWCTDKHYNILAIGNDKKGNGHFEDVLQWFEHSCRRDNKSLVFSDIMNLSFYKHLLHKRGFVPYKTDCAIKHFK